jgi:hypothetical protein
MFRCRSGKVYYGNEPDAWRAAARVIELGITEDLQVYLCPFCRHFHLRTARVQLHDWWWREVQRKGVRNWFKQRGQIHEWDS